MSKVVEFFKNLFSKEKKQQHVIEENINTKAKSQFEILKEALHNPQEANKEEVLSILLGSRVVFHVSSLEKITKLAETLFGTYEVTDNNGVFYEGNLMFQYLVSEDYKQTIIMIIPMLNIEKVPSFSIKN